MYAIGEAMQQLQLASAAAGINGVGDYIEGFMTSQRTVQYEEKFSSANVPDSPDKRRGVDIAGWPNEIFETGELEKASSASLKLVCPVCQLVMREPTAIRCSNDHALCQPCADKLAREAGSGHPLSLQYEYMKGQLKCPLDREVVSRERFGPATYRARQVNELRVHCSFKARGCVWTGELGSFSAHTSKCTIGHRPCSGCATDFHPDDLPAHEERCGLVPRACPNAALGCTAKVAESTRAVHAERCLKDLAVRLSKENAKLRSHLEDTNGSICRLQAQVDALEAARAKQGQEASGLEERVRQLQLEVDEQRRANERARELQLGPGSLVELFLFLAIIYLFSSLLWPQLAPSPAGPLEPPAPSPPGFRFWRS